MLVIVSSGCKSCDDNKNVEKSRIILKVIGQAKGHDWAKRSQSWSKSQNFWSLVERTVTGGEAGSAWPNLSQMLKRPTSINKETSLPAGLLEGVQASEGQTKQRYIPK